MKTRNSGIRHDYRRGKNGRFLYPWPWMRYGDYCILPKRLAKKASAAAYQYGANHGITFTCVAYGTQGRMRVTHTTEASRP